MPNPERNISKELEETISRLPKIDTFPFHSRLNPEYTTEHLLLSQTGANLLFALNRARQARELAISWRHFTVGATIMGLKAHPSQMRFMSGVNIKPEDGSVINIHAEQLALRKLKDEGFDMVSMVVVVGETQNDQQSGRTMNTLHPCGLCRTALLQSDIVDDKHTLIVSALPDFSVIEATDLAGLEAFHTTGDTRGIMRFDLEQDMELLTPHTGNEPIHLIETDKQIAEERVWFETVERPLTERRIALLGQLAHKQAIQ